ncbi:MAG: sigma-54 interaction domain-containing protein [Bradymonadaceae bacterium]
MSTKRTSILIIGPKTPLVAALDEAFSSYGWMVHRCEGAEDGPTSQRECLADVVIVTANEGPDHEEAIRALCREFFVSVIAIVKDGDVPGAVAAVCAGADTALEEGRDPVDFVAAAAKCLELEELSEVIEESDPRDILVRHPRSPLNAILESFPQIARSGSAVLITGESGTGKERVARILHQMSDRGEGPFVAVNCGAISESLLESELFGHSRGAFTGAIADRDGQFQAAQGGTIFLDEIATLPLQLQVKLLRILEDGKVHRVGETTPVVGDFRVIAASNIDLEEAVEDGEFRRDLYYRLSVFPVNLPPLRHRTMDIPVLADHFIEEQNELHGTCLEKLTPDIRVALKQYPWPGNIRELQNMIQRLCILKQVGCIEEEDLPPPIMETSLVDHLGLDVPSEGIDIAGTLDRLEDHLLIKALNKAAGNKAKAARLLGLNRTTLVEKLKRKRLDLADF